MALARWEVDALMLPGDLVTLDDLIPARPSWMARASCRSVDTAIFFPSRDDAVRAEARAICASCPVSTPCLAYAVDTDAEGTWAATSKRQRRAVLRDPRAS